MATRDPVWAPDLLSWVVRWLSIKTAIRSEGVLRTSHVLRDEGGATRWHVNNEQQAALPQFSATARLHKRSLWARSPLIHRACVSRAQGPKVLMTKSPPHLCDLPTRWTSNLGGNQVILQSRLHLGPRLHVVNLPEVVLHFLLGARGSYRWRWGLMRLRCHASASCCLGLPDIV